MLTGIPGGDTVGRKRAAVTVTKDTDVLMLAWTTSG